MGQHLQTKIDADCQGELPPLAVAGLELFNQGAYFEAHEALELAWRQEKGPVRELYRAILQIGIAYYQIIHRNYRGAVKMFSRCKPWLAPFPQYCQGIDLKDLRRNFLAAEAELIRLGPERISEFPAALLKPVIYSSGGKNER
jgi:hypothetical protein